MGYYTDGIVLDFYQKYLTVLGSGLSKFCDNCFNGAFIPAEINMSYITLNHKKD